MEDENSTVTEPQVTEPITQTVSKDTFDKTAKELADYKKKWKATLDDAEQARIEKEEKEEQLKELMKENSKMKLQTSLATTGLDEKFISKIADSAVDGDFDGLANAVKKALEAKVDMLQKEVDRLQLEATQRPNDEGGTGGKETKIDYKNMSISELQALYEKSPELFVKD